jgi:hypothetical protein
MFCTRYLVRFPYVIDSNDASLFDQNKKRNTVEPVYTEIWYLKE